jgi:hypothetical protein
MYRIASSLSTRRILWVHDAVQTPLPSYIHAAAERRSVKGYEGHVNPDGNRYQHMPGAKRTSCPA